MHFSKLSQIAVLLIAINLAASGNAQSNSDFMALVSETSSGEFDVEGAVEVDHAEALELHKAGVVFVDVRREIQYNLRHIAGAIGLELKSQLSEQSLAEQVAKLFIQKGSPQLTRLPNPPGNIQHQCIPKLLPWHWHAPNDSISDQSNRRLPFGLLRPVQPNFVQKAGI